MSGKKGGVSWLYSQAGLHFHATSAVCRGDNGDVYGGRCRRRMEQSTCLPSSQKESKVAWRCWRVSEPPHAQTGHSTSSLRQ
eukprot:3093619-Rhodomonas_salina.3